jgi:ankyrin repeat protein/L-ascorbate metabolism protein UlaG (beta-lactamase superfamily)
MRHYTRIPAALLICASILLANEVHDAIMCDDIEGVKMLLDENPDLLNSRDNNLMTPLNLAALNGKREIFMELLRRGGDIEIGDIDNTQPIQCSAIGGDIVIAESLLSHGATIKARDDNGGTALIFAASYQHMEMVKFLIERGAKINACNNRGFPALFYAVLVGNREIVESLLENGAKIDSEDNEGNTALHYGVVRGRTEICELLIEHGARIQARNNHGETPLFWVYGGNCYGAVKMLVEKGADVNVQSESNTTPLHSAAAAGDTSIAGLLLEHGAVLDAIDDAGWTPLSMAALSSIDMTRFLLEKGAAVNFKICTHPEPCTCQNNFMTPLHCAVQSGNVDIVKLLVERGAKINVQDEDGMTPLHSAIREGNQDIAMYILDKGAEIDMRDVRFSRTELHTAAITGQKMLVQALIERGADIHARDDENKTPREYALYHKFYKIAELLDEGKEVVNESDFLVEGARVSSELEKQEAIVWYLGHSGWAIKTKNHLLIFDYFLNPMHSEPDDAELDNGYIVPEQIKEIDVIVFCSHSHADHYNENIFQWRDAVSTIDYVLGFRPRDQNLDYIFLGPRCEQEIDDIKISTIRSNDEGVGFLVEVDGLVIFHAGDHANPTPQIDTTYAAEIDAIEAQNIHIDLAFFPLLGCSLGTPESVKNGVYYAIEKLKPTVLFPMHARDATYRFREFAQEKKLKKYPTQIMYALNRGDRFMFAKDKIKKIEM